MSIFIGSIIALLAAGFAGYCAGLGHGIEIGHQAGHDKGWQAAGGNLLDPFKIDHI